MTTHRIVWDAMTSLPDWETLYNRSPSFRLSVKQLETHVLPALRAGSTDGHMIRLAVEAMVRGFATQAEETDRRHQQLMEALSTAWHRQERACRRTASGRLLRGR